MIKNLSNLNWEIVKFFGEKSVEYSRLTITFKKDDVKGGVGHIKKIQEEFQQEVNLLIEGGAYGHMNHPFDDNNLMFSDLREHSY